MQYELGQYLRERYIENTTLLRSAYSRYEIYVRSTDLNRTLMSAQADLAGLYPPTEDQKWNPAIMWQPIPVHTQPVPDDYVSVVVTGSKFILLLLCDQSLLM